MICGHEPVSEEEERELNETLGIVRRTINLKKETIDEITEYCAKNNLNSDFILRFAIESWWIDLKRGMSTNKTELRAYIPEELFLQLCNETKKWGTSMDYLVECLLKGKL